MGVALRTSIDILLGNYSYNDLGELNTVHNVILMIHAIITFIFLASYMASILTTAYPFFIQDGDFSYKSIKYQFFEKYAKALELKNGLKEMILWPAPINMITIWLIPLSINKALADRFGGIISKILFWIENIFYFLLFLIYEILLIPLVAVKVYWNIFKVGSSK